MLTLRISVDRTRVGRGKARIEKSVLFERGATAWDWLRHDERGRIVGLVIASIAMSIAMSLLATVVARAVECRRAAAAPAAEAELARGSKTGVSSDDGGRTTSGSGSGGGVGSGLGVAPGGRVGVGVAPGGRVASGQAP